PPGSLDRAHHHPGMKGWGPGKRVVDAQLSADPVRWVGEQLADLEGLAEGAGLPVDGGVRAEAQSLGASVAEAMAAAGGLLPRVRSGELAVPPAGEPVPSARIGWL